MNDNLVGENQCNIEDGLGEKDLLQFALREGMLDLAYVQERIIMKKREEILLKHPYSIWQGSNDHLWYTYLPDETKARGFALKKRKTKEAIETLVMDYWSGQKVQEKEKVYLFNDVYFLWRGIQDQLVSENSVAKYETDYNRFFDGTEFVQMRIEDVSEDDIRIYMCNTIKNQKLCKETARKLFGYVSNTILHARKKKLISDNPMEFLRAKDFYKYCTEEYKPDNKKIISDMDMKCLREQFQRDHESNPQYIPTYAVEFASLTGMRVGEIAALRWDSITDEYIVIDKSEKSNRKKNEFYIDKTKNGKIRFFPMTEEIRKLLNKVMSVEKEYGYFCEWVFANEKGRVHAKTISACSKTKCRQLGIDSKGIHAYRKTLNSKMRCNGVSATVAASMLGHTKEVNERYYTFDVTEMEERTRIVAEINQKMCAV